MLDARFNLISHLVLWFVTWRKSPTFGSTNLLAEGGSRPTHPERSEYSLPQGPKSQGIEVAKKERRL